MKKYGIILKYVTGLFIPIIAVMLCIIFENEDLQSFGFLNFTLLLPFYLFATNCIIDKNVKQNIFVGLFVPVLIIFVSGAVIISYMLISIKMLNAADFNSAYLDLRFSNHLHILSLVLLEICIYAVLYFVKAVIISKRSKNTSLFIINTIISATAFLLSVAVVLNFFGVFNLQDVKKCETLSTSILYDAFDNRGQYENCDSDLKASISSFLYKKIYDDISDSYNQNFTESYDFNCISTKIMGNKACVSYMYSYEQLDKYTSELLFGSAADEGKPNLIFLEKTNGQWIVADISVSI